MSVLLYSERLFLAINGSRVQTLTDLLKAIRHLPHLGGPSDSANLDGAITGGLSVAFPVNDDGPSNEILRVVILLSTGRLSTTAKLIKNQSGQVYAKPHLQFIQRILNHHLTLRPSKNQQEAEEKRLHDLGILLGRRVSYVFSIGLKGASETGVRLLANGDETHTLLIDNDQGYGILSIDVFDPSLIICPNPSEFQSPPMLEIVSHKYSSVCKTINLESAYYGPSYYLLTPINDEITQNITNRRGVGNQKQSECNNSTAYDFDSYRLKSSTVASGDLFRLQSGKLFRPTRDNSTVSFHTLPIGQ